MITFKRKENIMKKIILALAIVLTVGLTANAQRGGRDGFFNDWDDISNGLDRAGEFTPALPYQHGLEDNLNAPLGSGLLVLTALGAGYAVSRRRKK